MWEGIDPALLDAWKDQPQLRWLMASEPPETLRAGAIHLAAYDPTTRRIGLMGVHTDAGVTAIDRGARLVQAPHFGALELLSGNTATVLGVGGYLNQQPSAIVRRLDLATGQRDDLPIEIALGNIRAAALDPSARWLLALDEAPGGGRRLVRIDLASGKATVLLTGTTPKRDRQALAAMPGGNWVLVGSASSWDEHALTVFHVSPGGTVVPLRSWVGAGTLASGHAVANSRGVSFVLAGPQGWRPAGIANAEMQNAVDVDDLF